MCGRGMELQNGCTEAGFLSQQNTQLEESRRLRELQGESRAVGRPAREAWAGGTGGGMALLQGQRHR